MKNIRTHIWLLAIFTLAAPTSVVAAVRTDTSASFQREPIDFSKAADESDVLLIGDDHTQLGIKTFLMGRFKELHALGFRCLAIEMVPMRFQPALDRWNGTDQKLIRDHLIRYWGEKGPGIPDSFFNLVASAKREGLMVMALDPETTLLTDRESVNSSWVECIRRCLIGKEGGRMIVFGGSGHFQSLPDSIPPLLKAQSIRFSVLEFAGLESRESVEIELKTAELLGRAVPFRLRVTQESRRLALYGPFMVRDASDKTPVLSRWVIDLEPESQQIALNPASQ